MSQIVKKKIISTPKKFGFSTECFFLTLEHLHIGIQECFKRYKHIYMTIGRLRSQMESFGESHPLYAQSKKMMDRYFAEGLAKNVHVCNPSLIRQMLHLYNWTCHWLIHLTKENAYLHQVPEYIVGDITDFFSHLRIVKLVTKKNIIVNEMLQLDSVFGVLKFALTFMAGPFSLKNSHFRGQIANIIGIFLPEKNGASSFNVCGVDKNHIFNQSDILKEHLLPQLVNLYGSIEYGENQYYERHETRHTINEIIEFLWEYPAHQKAMIKMSQNPGSFDSFVNVICNDLSYLIDECLEHMRNIRETQEKMENTEEWRRVPIHEQKEMMANLSREEERAKSCMLHCNSTVHMLYYVTKVISKPFVAPDFVARTAEMLNYIIVTMVGHEVKIKNPKKYEFHPRTLLIEIIRIWMQLLKNKEFMIAVVKDERSYKPKAYNKAIKIISKRELLPSHEIESLVKKVDELAKVWEEMKSEEVDLSDAPDRFLDPLVMDIMLDPVILPSGNIVDRSTIKQHLMNDPRDPFNRSPLTIDDVKPATKLKLEIDEFIAAKKKK